ncbi:mycofactocin system transcriptional regulator [Mycolicibacterium sediminis]|uniref:TetR family transcriptional regulator n=1 Tax=Mycolicibacterium sediminis TaxID=1286180 RepID=A0A7I7QPG3_9MYCO|nr:mycofactocin system transcriptional regulator [Mycolicibacterium sediminis]BBY28279.1 TetR family transcriptional regulator [Mycolicibacterium sediminis]
MASPHPRRHPVAGDVAPRVGRRRSTTQDHIANVALELFADRGFDEVSVDDVAQAAGIARRTLFRYYPSKNAIPWGDFDSHLDHMRDLLDAVPADVPVGTALRSTLLAFNEFDAAETARHRQRMRVILETDALQAHSMTMYGGWRSVIAAFVARRVGADPAGLVPQTVAWTMLGVALSAYGVWLGDESASLPAALGAAFDTVDEGLSHLEG